MIVSSFLRRTALSADEDAAGDQQHADKAHPRQPAVVALEQIRLRKLETQRDRHRKEHAHENEQSHSGLPRSGIDNPQRLAYSNTFTRANAPTRAELGPGPPATGRVRRRCSSRA